MSLSSDSEPSEEWWLLRGGHGALVSRHEGTLDQLREGHSGPYLWTRRVLDWLPCGQGVSGERCCLQQGYKVRKTLNQSII